MDGFRYPIPGVLVAAINVCVEELKVLSRIRLEFSGIPGMQAESLVTLALQLIRKEDSCVEVFIE